jgi:hypothetical protein
MGKTGRKSALTKEVKESICATLSAAGTIEDAAIHAGVNDSTVYAWLAKGERQATGPYRDFLEAVKKAKAQRRIALEAGIRKHGSKNWQALAWLLERTEPKRYAQRVRVHVEEELSDAIERLKRAFADEPDLYERALSALVEGDRSAGAEFDSVEESRPDDSDGEAVRPSPPEPEATPLPKPRR